MEKKGHKHEEAFCRVMDKPELLLQTKSGALLEEASCVQLMWLGGGFYCKGLGH